MIGNPQDRASVSLDIGWAGRQQDFIPAAGVLFKIEVSIRMRSCRSKMRIVPEPVAAAATIDEIENFAPDAWQY